MRNSYVDRYAPGHEKEGQILCAWGNKQAHHGDNPEILPEDDPEILEFEAKKLEPLDPGDIYDSEINSFKLFKAAMLALNDGTFVPGANLNSEDLKAAIKSKL